MSADRLDKNKINVFNMNPEEEINDILKQDSDEINLYKLELESGTNVLGFTNCIYYKNKTLLFGMDLSTKMIVDLTDLEDNLKNNNTFRIIVFENEKDDFTKVNIKKVNLWE